MYSYPHPPRFWINWLIAVASGVVLFGLVLVVAPVLTRQGFSLLVFSSVDRIDTFGSEAARYISLAHAVIGAVMVGWGTALVYITRALLSKGRRVGWNLIALSVAAWFLPDTVYSISSGFWQNAVLNTGFLVMFVLPLWATRDFARNDA